jgi:hypothetical protein
MLGLLGSHFVKGFWVYLLFALSALVEGPLTILTSGAGIAQGLLQPVPIFAASSRGTFWRYRLVQPGQICPAGVD